VRPTQPVHRTTLCRGSHRTSSVTHPHRLRAVGVACFRGPPGPASAKPRYTGCGRLHDRPARPAPHPSPRSLLGQVRRGRHRRRCGRRRLWRRRRRRRLRSSAVHRSHGRLVLPAHHRGRAVLLGRGRDGRRSTRGRHARVLLRRHHRPSRRNRSRHLRHGVRAGRQLQRQLEPDRGQRRLQQRLRLHHPGDGHGRRGELVRAGRRRAAEPRRPAGDRPPRAHQDKK
jgi:hypothetical protein